MNNGIACQNVVVDEDSLEFSISIKFLLRKLANEQFLDQISDEVAIELFRSLQRVVEKRHLDTARPEIASQPVGPLNADRPGNASAALDKKSQNEKNDAKSANVQKPVAEKAAKTARAVPLSVVAQRFINYQQEHEVSIESKIQLMNAESIERVQMKHQSVDQQIGSTLAALIQKLEAQTELCGRQ